jgi:hypothetical protein
MAPNLTVSSPTNARIIWRGNDIASITLREHQGECVSRTHRIITLRGHQWASLTSEAVYRIVMARSVLQIQTHRPLAVAARLFLVVWDAIPHESR